MFAEASHPLAIPAADRFKALFWRTVHAVEPELPVLLPAELQRLPDRLLLDVGLEPHRVRPSILDTAVRPELIGRDWP